MTFKEKFDLEERGKGKECTCYCPYELGYEKESDCECDWYDECEDCWDREMPNKEEDKERGEDEPFNFKVGDRIICTQEDNVSYEVGAIGTIIENEYNDSRSMAVEFETLDLIESCGDNMWFVKLEDMELYDTPKASLKFKVGDRIICINNDVSGFYDKGAIGTVVRFESETDGYSVKFETLDLIDDRSDNWCVRVEDMELYKENKEDSAYELIFRHEDGLLTGEIVLDGIRVKSHEVQVDSYIKEDFVIRLVKQLYESVEKEKRKFRPHLEDENGKVLGYIGESMDIFDCYDELFHVGDVVCITGICETSISFVYDKEGMTNFLDIDGTPPMYEKMIAYKLISHNDVVNGVRAVLEEEK